MRPIRLEIQAFGPFVEKQVIDFESLSEKGIFLIKGNTGSGKTTIFDAMTFALYGGSSGEEDKVKCSRNDLEEWRCTQADWTVPTRVSFRFRIREKEYVFTRILEPKRKNLSVKREAGEAHGSDIVPFFSNPKASDLNAKAQELIGLTKEQFRQVILLPQGQFERFLTASSGDKEAILKKIFDSQRWGNYAEILFNNAKARKDQLDEIRKSISSSLEEEGMNTLENLENTLKELVARIDTLEDDHKAFDGITKQQVLNEDKRVYSEVFMPLHDNEAKMTELTGKKGEIDRKRSAWEEARRAEDLREVITSYEKARENRDERKKKEAECRDKLPAAQNEKERAAGEFEKHRNNSPIEGLNREIGVLNGKKRSYGIIDEKRGAFTAALSLWETAKGEFDIADKEYENASKQAADAFTIMDGASKIAEDFRNRYYRNIYGELAADLKSGEACPVCGSMNHPMPAEKHPDSVGKEEVDQKEKDAKTAKGVWEKAENKRIQKEENRRSKEELLYKRETDKNTALAELKSAEAELLPEIPDSNALEQRINDLKNRITGYNSRSKELETIMTDAQIRLTEVINSVRNAEQETGRAQETYQKAEQDLQTALAEKRFASYQEAKSCLRSEQERSLLHEEIVSYDTDSRTVDENIKKYLKEAQGKEEPDESMFESRQEEISREQTQFTENLSTLRQEEARLRKKQRQLKEKADNYDTEITQAAEDLAFARKLRGETGVGLQRYVLAVMFNQVIAEANRMLTKVHGGRYHLFRSDEKGAGNKTGLELKVHDSRSPEKDGRHVSMLSGGEKFLVSLALSIGMSTVAQKSGVQIDALFIDEGFGTLDNNSIQDAMDVLDSVRRSNGMIGIISHVQLLEANIPTHIEVVKTEKGSYIKSN